MLSWRKIIKLIKPIRYVKWGNVEVGVDSIEELASDDHPNLTPKPNAFLEFFWFVISILVLGGCAGAVAFFISFGWSFGSQLGSG